MAHSKCSKCRQPLPAKKAPKLCAGVSMPSTYSQGGPCQRRAQPGSRYCPAHEPVPECPV